MSVKKYVIFWLDKQKFALHLSIVVSVVRIVEVFPLTKTPKFILGTINFKGEFLPVINPRFLFDLPNKEINLSDQLIILNIASRKFALWVDSVSDITEQEDSKLIETNKILLNSNYVARAFKFNDEMVIILDLETFFKLNEKELSQATKERFDVTSI